MMTGLVAVKEIFMVTFVIHVYMKSTFCF